MELVSDFKAFDLRFNPPKTRCPRRRRRTRKCANCCVLMPNRKEAHRYTFLSGSYARHTAINDINDVDVICVLDIDRRITDAEVVLAWVEGILAKHYDNPKRQGRSIGVKAHNGVCLDIVPATPQTDNDGPLWIPDREARAWVQTHPKGQIAAGVNKNKATNGYFVQVVKLLKFWRDGLPTESCKLKSYVLEALVHGTIGYPTSHAVAIVAVLEGIERAYGLFRDLETVPIISDPGYTSVNVAKRLSATEFSDFMTQVKSAAKTARKALDEPNEALSRKPWRQLFGPTFG